MNDESFINAANYIASSQAGLRDRMSELEEAYIEDNRLLKYGQRVWVDGEPYALTSTELSYYKQCVYLTYTLRPHVEDGSQSRRDVAAIHLYESSIEDWENVSVEKP